MPPTSDTDLERARFRGALLGIAAGDAVGTTIEFKSPGTFEPVVDMVGGGPFGLAPGQWTDDTSMALCLAESLVERGGFDPRDQMERYVRWWRDGYLSSTGGFFDIGGTVSAALRRFEATGEPYAGATNPQSAGNGSLMQLAPVPMFYAADPRAAVERAADSSRTTHGAATAVDACRYMAGLIVGALAGAAKDELLAPRYSPVPGLWEERPLATEVDEVAAGSFLRREPPEIEGSGFVVRSLEAALWAFARGASFREGALLAANLGHDADTTAAVYGSSRALTTARRGSPRGGGRSSRSSRRSRSSPTGCTTPPEASPPAPVYESTGTWITSNHPVLGLA
jgi:ADP-ribosyl-[dinitrogen reductase] hydrolase